MAMGQQAPAPAPTAAPKPAPAPAAVPQAAPEREGIEDMFSISAFYWMPNYGQPGFRAGKFVADPTSGFLNLTSKPYRANGIMLTFPTGGFNRLEIGYWRINDSGDLRAPAKLAMFGANIANNELLNTKYKISNIRAAWNYLSFPVPPYDAKLRIKSFWEVQYTTFLPTIYFPTAKNSPAPIQPKQSVIYPGVGLGVEYVAGRMFRMEARGSGMTLPGKSGYYDVEGNAVARIKSVEIFGGIKGFHFHTSSKQETWTRATMWGPMFGLRYVIH
ncbi:MAG: hypothetical protein ABIR70_12230 [Bryobacteraceae bacterium]